MPMNRYTVSNTVNTNRLTDISGVTQKTISSPSTLGAAGILGVPDKLEQPFNQLDFVMSQRQYHSAYLTHAQ